jgi:NTP pyrophosphatase (non-canonical NTP hydrolase)
MDHIKSLQDELIKFREDRDWTKFHNPKDIALSITLEAAELLEHFQWKNDLEIQKYITDHKDEIGEEIADVFNWLLILSRDLDIDLLDAAKKKIEKNGAKYPIEKSKGRAVKYDRL